MASNLSNVFNRKSDHGCGSNDGYNLMETARHGFPYAPMCMDYDPIQSLLAIGTKTGCIRILGRPGVDVLLRHEGEVAVVGLQFIVNEGRLVSATSDDCIHAWDLTVKRPLIIHSLEFQRDRITCVEMAFPSTWLFVGTDKGNVFVVGATSLEMSGYSVMWNKTMAVNQKSHPGYVTQIVENPADQSKILIGYSSGLIVLWDLSRKLAEHHYQTTDVTCVSWHHEGKSFMTSHIDGRLAVWNAKSPLNPEKSWMPHRKDGESSEACQPITKLEWKSNKSGDSTIIFAGGLSQDRGLTPSLTLTFSLEKVMTFKLDAPVIDFVAICSTPFGNAVQDPHTLVVLTKEEFIMVDLLNQNLLPFEPAYPFDVHESRVTCCFYLADCCPDITPLLYSITTAQKKTTFTDKEWPIKGGQWGSPVSSYSEIIITGHENGSVKFWDATGVNFLMLFKLRTAKMFESESIDSPASEAPPARLGTPPTRRQTPPDFIHKDSNPYAIHHIAFCDESKLLCVAGSYHSILFDFTKSESSAECTVIDVHLVDKNPGARTSQDSGNSFGSDASCPEDEKKDVERAVRVKSGPIAWLPGYKPEFCCSVVWHHGNQSSPITCLALNSKYGLLSIGNDMGLAIVDILSKVCLFAFACPDLYGNCGSLSRRPSLACHSVDQSEDGKQRSLTSSVSIDYFDKLVMTNDGDNSPSVDAAKPEGEGPLPDAADPLNPKGEGSKPKPPPRYKKQKNNLRKMNAVEESQSHREIKSPTIGSPVAPPTSSDLSPISLASCDSWLIVDAKDESQEVAGGVLGDTVEAASLGTGGSNKTPEGEFVAGGPCGIPCCSKSSADPHEVGLLSIGGSSIPRPRSEEMLPPPPLEGKVPSTTGDSSREAFPPESCATKVRSIPSRGLSVPFASANDLKSSAPAPPTWKQKLNRMRHSLMNTVSVLVSGSVQSNASVVKFKVIDLSNDKPAILKEMTYSSYIKRCKVSLSGAEAATQTESSIDGDIVIRESLLDLTFVDSLPHKNEATPVPCLWIGTSLGSVIVLEIESIQGESSTADLRILPTGTIFHLKGDLVNISFLSSDCKDVLQPPKVSLKEFAKHSRDIFVRRTFRDPASTEPLQRVVLTSSQQIRVISLPSQTCTHKHKIADDNLIIKAKAVIIKDAPCLLTYHKRGNIMIFDLPTLEVTEDMNYIPHTHPRLSKTFNFSNFGYCSVMMFPSEIQKFLITRGNDDQLSDLYKELYVACSVPEPPKAGFFQNLFDSQSKLDREALFGESGSGQASRTLNKHISRMDRTQGSALSATSEIGQAKQAALERGEKLGELEEKTGQLRMNAEAFAQMSAQLKNKYKTKKWYQF